MENLHLKENGTWRPNRIRFERRLSLFATVTVLVACGFFIVMTALIHRLLYSTEVFYIDMVPPSSAALTAIRDCEVRNSVCYTPGCVFAAANLLKNMNKKIDPCEDFYSFSCGGFITKTAIPEDMTEVDTFNVISDKVRKQLRLLIERPIKEDDAEPFKLVKKLYQSCVNKTLIEELGLDPLKDILQQFGGWPVVEGDKWNDTNFVWYEMIYKFRQVGNTIRYLIDFTVEIDMKNSSSRIVNLSQAILDALDREYLIEGLENQNVKAYLEFQINLAMLLGADEEGARLQQTQALEFEIMLAKICPFDEKNREVNKLYNPMSIKELSMKVPGIPWLEYLNTILAPYHVLTEDERVNVAVPDYFSNLVDLLEKTPKRTLANYLMWRVSFDSVGYLNDAARKLYRKYAVALTGTFEDQLRWKECMEDVQNRLDFAIGAMYVREYFDEDVRQSAKEMVDDIRSAFIEMIEDTKWMENKTMMEAKKKAALMKAHIAYPDELLIDKTLIDYHLNLTLNSNDYLRNSLNIRKFYVNHDFYNLRERINKADWTAYRSPTEVNADNSLLLNTIRLSAGILQGSFFGKDRPTYLNYATAGWTVGHEITHGFDDIGRQFDPEGNLIDWWEEPTKTNFLDRAQCIINQYGNYTCPEIGLKINGYNTQGENIADNGGIKAHS